MKILVIRFGSLGDLILATPLISVLKDHYHSGELHLVCKQKYASLFDNDSRVDRIHELGEGNFGELMDMRARLKDENFDIIIDAHNVLRSNILHHSLSASRKIQLSKRQGSKFFLIYLKINLFRSITPLTRRYLELAGKLGIKTGHLSTSLQPGREEKAKAVRIMKGTGISAKNTVAVAPGARWETKRWPAEYYARLIERLTSGGIQVIITGGESDMQISREITGQVEGEVTDLTGRLSLLETAACLERCAALVTNDSAPLHMAEAVGTPCVALFGPTVKEFGYFPSLPSSKVLEVPLWCRPCSRNGASPCLLRNRKCLRRIKPRQAEQAVYEIVETGSGNREKDNAR